MSSNINVDNQGEYNLIQIQNTSCLNWFIFLLEIYVYPVSVTKGLVTKRLYTTRVI